VDAITERHRISTMKEVVHQLSSLIEEWETNGGDIIPEIDLTKIRTFEFQESLQKREIASKGLHEKACVLCNHFDEHVGPNYYFTLGD
jgi:antiviral helicase SKI2